MFCRKLGLDELPFILMERSSSFLDAYRVQVNKSAIIVGCVVAGLSVFVLIILIMLAARRYRTKNDNESQQSLKTEETAVEPPQLPQPSVDLQMSQRAPDIISQLPAASNALSNSHLLRSVSRLPSILLRSTSLFSVTTAKSNITALDYKEPENKRHSRLKAFYLHPAEVPNWIAGSPLVRSRQSLFDNLRVATQNQPENNSKEQSNVV
ncbi:hypothetical protein K450DRAFT_262705 [Umbelopsis ramanniana AG]|uniref:Uncharacterized protein n=1 Tax=Umbelopsis ramanniana AG TaxID=1314678 RepID=A0AAD5E445_UMBRA|nr:uncharacterized protein K450DRAFT_262705 [Umbelopsis ramanniana AG]KAI8575230.1 hypothetical protein K450DRAFT_262705 [Umbelopsis ramanniana AG]